MSPVYPIHVACYMSPVCTGLKRLNGVAKVIVIRFQYPFVVVFVNMATFASFEICNIMNFLWMQDIAKSSDEFKNGRILMRRARLMI